MSISEKIKSLSKIYKYKVLANFSALPPTLLKIFITPRCNFYCQMCGIWKRGLIKEQELKFSDWQKMMKDPIFSKVEVLNINGGEPFLHPELSSLINLYLESMPKLRELSINTNGFFTQKIVSLVKDLAFIAEKRGITFLISVSIDGLEKTHDYLRGFPGAFKKAEETILALKNLQKNYNFVILINCVIFHKNLHEVDKIVKWCDSMGINARFSPIVFYDGYFSNTDQKNKLDFTEEDKKYLLKILKKLFSNTPLKNPLSYFYYDMYHLYKNKKNRTAPCRFMVDGFTIDCLGEVYYCLMIKKIGKISDNSSIGEIYYKPENLAYRRQAEKPVCRNCNSSPLCESGIERNFLKFFWFNLVGKRF